MPNIPPLWRFENYSNRVVKLTDLCPQIVLALTICHTLWWRAGIKIFYVTSVNDGKHGHGSLHPHGKAIDLRRWNVPQPHLMLQAIRASLPKDFDVILEYDHFHIEYDPK